MRWPPTTSTKDMRPRVPALRIKAAYLADPPPPPSSSSSSAYCSFRTPSWGSGVECSPGLPLRSSSRYTWIRTLRSPARYKPIAITSKANSVSNTSGQLGCLVSALSILSRQMLTALFHERFDFSWCPKPASNILCTMTDSPLVEYYRINNVINVEGTIIPRDE